MYQEGSAINPRHRFRWAVCQIDVLRWLKCERDNVKKALKNLPKTLDEIYELILLAIPHEDLVVVSHILQWISYHNELYQGEGIPCEILIQAVGKSTRELTTDGLERFYDNDTLRELCGCLIKILPEERSAGLLYKGTVDAVSFAHYTVREYLDSRCSTNTVISSTLGQEELRQRFLEVVLSEVYRIGLNQQWKFRNANVDPSVVFEAINGSFNDYCTVSAILSLYEWPTEMSQQERLCSMAIDLLNPSRPHYETLKCAAAMIDASTPLFSRKNFSHGGLVVDRRFWRQHWHAETSNVDAVHLSNLLYLGQSTDECLPLAEKFLRVKDTRDFLQARIRFEKEISNQHMHMDEKSYLLDGSIIEIFAQLAIRKPSPLMLLLDHGAGLFDCSKVLLLYIGSHVHNLEGAGYCPLKKLLELGADPNSRGSRITPLQIAVVSWDLDGVRTLLNAGADPNDVGSSGGIVWEDGTFMSRFNHLDGASALYIYRSFGYIGPYHSQKEYIGPRHRENLETIEATLLQHGAKEFLRS